MTNAQGFDEVLDICLDRLQQGDTVEACLVSYPAYAGRLAPVLQMAEVLRVPDGPSMSARGFRAGQVRLLQRAARLRAERGMVPPVERESPLRRVLVGSRRLLAGTIVGVVLFCIVLGAGAVTVSAASTSLPGSPLYSVKRATENLLSSAAFTPRLKARAHLAWAERRLVEIGALINRDGVVYRTLLASLQSETEQALKAAREVGPEMLAAVAAHAEHQQTMLAEYREQVPELSRVDLDQALVASAALQEQAQAALSGQVPVRPTFGPVASATFVLPGFTPTGAASEVVEGPITPTPTRAPGVIDPTTAPGEPDVPTATPVLAGASPTPFGRSTVTVTPIELASATPGPTSSGPAVTEVPPEAPVASPVPPSTNTPVTLTYTPVTSEMPVPTETPTPIRTPSETPTPTSMPTETPTPEQTVVSDGWDRSSLMFIDRGALCEGGGVVWAIVKNGGEAMTGASVWELWYASSGPPKQGTPIADGEIPALGAGQEYTIDEEVGEGSGNYMFKAFQRPGHPGDGVLWSNEIVFECGN